MRAGLRSLLGGVLLAAPLLQARAQRAAPFRVEETTIAEIHAAMTAGRLTCRALVERYLARIAAYDKSGPAINALVVVNPEALKVADSLDARSKSGGLTGQLHCIPMIVKDNFETIGLPVTAEATLIRMAYGDEQGTHHRHLPESAPPLP